MTWLDDSLLALGSCIAGIGVLASGLLALLFRQTFPPRWTRPETVALLVCVPVAATIGLGLGYVVYGLSGITSGAGNPRELLAPATVALVLLLAWRALRIRQRLKAYALATAAGSPDSPPAIPSSSSQEAPAQPVAPSRAPG